MNSKEYTLKAAIWYVAKVCLVIFVLICLSPVIVTVGPVVLVGLVLGYVFFGPCDLVRPLLLMILLLLIAGGSLFFFDLPHLALDYALIARWLAGIGIVLVLATPVLIGTTRYLFWRYQASFGFSRLVQRAQELHDREDYEEAVVQLRRAESFAARFRKDRRAAFELGWKSVVAQRRAGDFHHASSHARKVLEPLTKLDPAEATALFTNDYIPLLENLLLNTFAGVRESGKETDSALRACERMLGEEHPAIVPLLDLAVLAGLHAGKRYLLKERATRALAMRGNGHDPGYESDHREAAAVITHQFAIHMADGEFQEAEHCIERLLAYLGEHGGPAGSPPKISMSTLSSSIDALGESYLERKDLPGEGFLHVFQRTLRFLAERFHPTHYLVMSARHTYQRLLRQMERVDEADAFLRELNRAGEDDETSDEDGAETGPVGAPAPAAT